MNPALLDSQFATLEEPSTDEAIHIDASPLPPQIVDDIMKHLS